MTHHARHGGGAFSLHGAASSNHGIGWPRLYDFLILLLTRGRDRAYRERVLDLTGAAPAKRLLDIGCGTGTQVIEAWRRLQPGGSIVGVDISEPMLAAARRKARRAGIDVPFQRADASALPFEDGSFDVVTMTTVMHMVPESRRELCLSEMSRVLKPGGQLLLIDYAGDPASRAGLVAKHGRHGSFDLNRMREPLAEAGFRNIDCGSLGWLDLHYMRGSKQ